MPVVAAVPASARKDRRRGAFAVFVAAVVLLAFLLLWNPFGGTPVAATPNRDAAVRKEIETVLTRFSGGSELRLDDRNGSLTVVGYVPTPAVRRELAAAIAPVSSAVRVNVIDTAGLADAASRVLKMHRLDFAASPGGPGEVIVTGVTNDLAAWKKIKPRLATDVPKMRTLTDRVTPPNQPKAVAVQPPATSPEVAPAPPPALVQAPDKTAESTPDDPSTPPTAVSLAIRSITIGQSRALVLETGERVFEGATLPGGYTVKSIAADRVVLTRQGEESIVQVGESR
jgi:hypothetical protein